MNVTELRGESSSTNFTKLVEIVGENLKYETAGNIAIYPLNNQKKIERLKKVMNFSFNYIFTVTSKSKEKLPIPSPLSFDNYVKYFVDLNGEITQADVIRLEELLSPKKYSR